MAGVKGMASPEQIKPVSPELNIDVPEGMQFSSPQDQFVEAPAKRPSLDEIFADEAPQSAVSRPSLDEIFGQAEVETEPIGKLIELGARAKSSFAITQKELRQSLEQSYGKQNVREVDGKLEFRNGTKGDWAEWDAGFEPVGDVLDFTRSVVEEVPAAAATALAAIPAVAATIGTGGAAAAPSAAAVAGARAAGAVVGQGLGDILQASLGIERDPERNAALEYSLSAALSPIAGAVGDFATKKLTQRASQQVKLLAPKDLFKTEIGNVKESVDFLKSKGLLENIPGTDTPVILSQLNPSNPQAQLIAKKASKLPQFNQALEQQAQQIESGMMGFIKGLGNVLGEAPETGTKFKNLVTENIKREGKLIGDARKMLVDQAGKNPMPVPKMQAALKSMIDETGAKIPSADAITGALLDGGYSDEAAKKIGLKLANTYEEVFNNQGRLTASELMGKYEELNGYYRTLVGRGQSVDGKFKQLAGKLRSIVADEIIDKVDVIAGKESKSAYVKNLREYKLLTEAADEFNTLFKNEKIASHSLSKAIFDKGKNGLDTLEAAKVLLKDSPEVFDQVKGNYLKEVRAKHFNSVTGKTNWNSFLKDVNGLGDEMIDSAFGANAKEGLKHWATLMKSVEEGLPNLEKPQEKAKVAKNMLLSLVSKFTAASTMVGELIDIDADKYLAQAISRDGIESFLATVPKQQKGLVRSVLEGVQSGTLKTATALPTVTRETFREKRETKQ